MKNRLFYGDNLRILRRDIADESVDLVYLDPPFNSNRSYNVLFKHKSGESAQAQIEAFDDTWTWSQDAEGLYIEMIEGGAPGKVAEAITAMRRLLGENDVLAYLVMMTARLVELHRVLKPTGSLYLHCDPTASHYLKIMLDAIFGPTNFMNEITWRRTYTHGNVGRNYGSVADILLFYVKGPGYTWNQPYVPIDEEYARKRFSNVDPDGRRWQSVTLRNPSPRPNLHYPYTASNGVTYQPHPNGWAVGLERMEKYDREDRLHYPAKAGGQLRVKQYLDETPGIKASNIWDDVFPINSQAAERLGYPTQKPVALLERIVAASSNPGDTVLDPFCGCGTTIAAAQKLERRWVGIDITYLAIDLIQKRLAAECGDDVSDTFELRGVPRELEAAQALFGQNHFDFERWAVSLVMGQPNEKQGGGDRGIDGVIRFHLNEKDIAEALVSVKGGRQLNPAMVRDLRGTVERQRAEMGVLITLAEPTKGMLEEARSSGSFDYEFSGARFPKIQILTVAELLKGKKPHMPSPINPYKIARRRSGQLSMLD
jgi:adenine specific DNA methylase Mod